MIITIIIKKNVHIEEEFIEPSREKPKNIIRNQEYQSQLQKEASNSSSQSENSSQQYTSNHHYITSSQNEFQLEIENYNDNEDGEYILAEDNYYNNTNEINDINDIDYEDIGLYVNEDNIFENDKNSETHDSYLASDDIEIINSTQKHTTKNISESNRKVRPVREAASRANQVINYINDIITQEDDLSDEISLEAEEEENNNKKKSAKRSKKSNTKNVRNKNNSDEKKSKKKKKPEKKKVAKKSEEDDNFESIKNNSKKRTNVFLKDKHSKEKEKRIRKEEYEISQYVYFF